MFAGVLSSGAASALSSIHVAAEDPAAAGAAMDQVAIATAWGFLMTVGLLFFCLGHRSGRVRLLGVADTVSRRVSGLPGWAGLPSLLALLTLLPALFGLQWDESLHLTSGRDPGPLANPSHYILLFGIFGGFSAGIIAMAMGDRSVPRSGIQLARGWRAPLGGVLLAGGSAVALIGFPADDLWHRLFGQDVTLWGPTHVAMIGGMSLAVIGAIVLNVEGTRAREFLPLPEGMNPLLSRAGALLPLLTRGLYGFRFVMLAATPLLVVSLLQGEFDWGIPQFRLIFHPMLVMVAAGVALVAARIYLGRGAAIAGALAFLAIRGGITLILAEGLDKPVHVFPLYLAEAALIELVALRVSPREAPLRFGLWCGALIGSIGLAAEWAWSTVFRIPWNSALFPEVLVLGPAMAIAGAVFGAWMGAHLTTAPLPRSAPLRRGAVIASLAVAAMIGYGLSESPGAPVSARVTLADARPVPNREVNATVRLHPPEAAQDAEWLRSIAWQGGGFESDALRQISPGVYRTVKPLPVHGKWKSAIRLARGRSLEAIPVFLPRDIAIPAAEVPAPARFTRSFADEKSLLQREAKDAGQWEWTAAVIAVALILTALLGLWALALRRLAGGVGETAPAAWPSRRTASAGDRAAGVPA